MNQGTKDPCSTRIVTDKVTLEEFNTSIFIEDSEANDFAVELAIFQCNPKSIEQIRPTQAASKQNPRETNQPMQSTVEIGCSQPTSELGNISCANQALA